MSLRKFIKLGFLLRRKYFKNTNRNYKRGFETNGCKNPLI